MLAVVGLGNPGSGYRSTRHNAGYMVVDGIAEGRYFPCTTSGSAKKLDFWRLLGRKSTFGKSSFGSYLDTEAETEGSRFRLVKPTTFMNESGRACTALLKSGTVKDLSEMLVVSDDVDLDLGRVRFRTKGSAGGHNGLKSIIAHLGSTEFARLRIGVGPRPAGEDLVSYVLTSFSPNERSELDDSLEYAAEIIKIWVTSGVDAAVEESARR